MFNQQANMKKMENVAAVKKSTKEDNVKLIWILIKKIDIKNYNK